MKAYGYADAKGGAGKARRSFHRRCPHPKGGVRSGRADKLYAQRHPARRQLSGDHEVGTPATLNRLTSARPAVKASCGASMDGAVEKATGSSRKSTWSEAKKASTC